MPDGEAEVLTTFTITGVAAVLGIGRSLAYAAARRGEIKSLRLGRRVLIPRSALAALPAT